MKNLCNVFFICKSHVLFISKIAFSCLFPLLCVLDSGLSKRFFALAIIDSLFIAYLSIVLAKKSKKVAYIVGAFLFFLMNIEFAALYWGNSFVGAYMLTNLDFVSEISGNFFKYGATIISILVFSFLPAKIPSFNKRMSLGVFCFFLCFYPFTISSSKNYKKSFFYGVYSLAKEFYNLEKDRKFAQSLTDLENLKKKFYKKNVADFISKPDSIPEKPNIILIFTEGLSQNVIDDERNITPCVKNFQDKSISFANYYNHTFATFMGLQGQLFSGYQQSNYDANSLISIQNILEKNGYSTSYILTEPKSNEMVEYISSMRFGEVVTEQDIEKLNGVSQSISDKDAYSLLYDTAIRKNKNGTPFFIAMYTLGTHCSIDSIDEKFCDGSNPVLNRFYDMDCQFGLFFEKFRKSDLLNNTIIVFTTDHASYQDNDFVKTFPNYKRDYPWFDKIPLSFFYNGVQAEKIDAGNRNSLDLVCKYW